MVVRSQSNPYGGQLGDIRLERKSIELEEALSKNITSSIRQLADTRSKRVSYYRFLSNPKVKEQALIRSVAHRISPLVKGKHILCAQDTSELHYHGHMNQIQDVTGLGEAGRSSLGYFLHPSLVINAEDGMVLGLSDIHLFDRPWDRHTDSSTRKQRSIEDKESYKWIQAAQSSKAVLQDASQVTFIQDRDGDIYETFVQVRESNFHLLIRSKTDRNLFNEQYKTLYEKVADQSPTITYALQVSGDNKKREKRMARMELRFSQGRIKRPVNISKDYPEYIELSIVEAKEVWSSVPQDESPITWRLLTTHPITDFVEAMHIVHWYSQRWYIEDFFRILKLEGFNLEAAELETGSGLRKLGILTMQAAVKVLQLRQARQENSEAHIDLVFNEQEQEYLKAILPSLEGQTEKLKNPYPPHLLIWAYWIIARLGGWCGYDSQRPAGVITLSRGLDKFQVMLLGYQIAMIQDRKVDTS